MCFLQEDFKSLVEDMDELTKNDGDSESLAEERAARRHAEDTLRKVAMEMEALKKHHGSQLQAMMQKLQTAQQERGTNHDIETALMQSEQEVQALLAKRNEAQLALRLLVREVELLRAGPEGGGLESDESRTEEKFSWKKQARVLADEGMSEAWALLTDIKNELRKPTASLKSSSSPPRRAIPASPLRQSPAESLPSKPSQIKPEDAPQIILQQLHTSKSSKAAHQNAPTHVPATASPLPRAAPRGVCTYPLSLTPLSHFSLLHGGMEMSQFLLLTRPCVYTCACARLNGYTQSNLRYTIMRTG